MNRGEVTVAFHHVDDAIACSITDNGPGIPRGVLDRLGEYGSTQGKQAGNGLGLSHAIEALKRMGGRLQVANNQPLGATVSIVLKQASSP